MTPDCENNPIDDLPFRHRRVRFFWLGFIAIPILQLFGTDPTPVQVVLQLLGLAVWFGIAFRTMNSPMMRRPSEVGLIDRPLAWVVAIVALTAALTMFGVSSWSVLFPAAAVYTVRLTPQQHLLRAALIVSVVSFGGTYVQGGFWSAIAVAATTAGVGLLMSMIRVTIEANTRLREAQDELARLAVSEERMRFARDMHDLIGHSLSVIALKAELAGRLLPDRPDDAAQHVAEIEGVARGALAGVREAVSGYRRPELEAELAGARMALDAAGIELRVEQTPVGLDPDAEAVLAWAVREGTTNVIRHSGARHCRIAVAPQGGEATVVVSDDGRGGVGGVGGASSEGNGLEGLRERAAGVHGRVAAETPPDGGFRLSVTVPGEATAVPA